LQGDHWLVLDRYAENPAVASLPTFPEYGSKYYPATAMQLRQHRERQAWFKAWSEGEGARQWEEIRKRHAAACKPAGEPQAKPETPEVNSGDPGKPTAIYEHPAPPLNVVDYRQAREERGLPEHPGSSSTYEKLPQVRQSNERRPVQAETKGEPGAQPPSNEKPREWWKGTGRDDSPIAEHLPEPEE
jgi:hypothetical protein